MAAAAVFEIGRHGINLVGVHSLTPVEQVAVKSLAGD